MERHATWFELYFDLVFAAAIFELATGLADDPSTAVFARFAGLFVAVSLAWTLWALAGGIAAFALALAILHLGAEWTSPRNRTLSDASRWPRR